MKTLNWGFPRWGKIIGNYLWGMESTKFSLKKILRPALKNTHKSKSKPPLPFLKNKFFSAGKLEKEINHIFKFCEGTGYVNIFLKIQGLIPRLIFEITRKSQPCNPLVASNNFFNGWKSKIIF